MSDNNDIEDAEIEGSEGDTFVIGVAPVFIDVPGSVERVAPDRTGKEWTPVRTNLSALLPWTKTPVADALLVDREWLASTPLGSWLSNRGE